MTEEDIGLWKALRGMSKGGWAVLKYGLDSVEPPRLGSCMPPSGPKLGVGRVGSRELPNGGSCIPPLGAIEGENNGWPSPSLIAERDPNAGVSGTDWSFPLKSLPFERSGRGATGLSGVSGTDACNPFESEVVIVRPSLLRRGGWMDGPINDGEEGSENGRSAGCFPTCGSPADVT